MKGWSFFKGRAVPWRKGSRFWLPRARRCFLCVCVVFMLPLLVAQQAFVFCYCGQFLRPNFAPRLGPTPAPYIRYFQERHWRDVDIKTALVWDEKFPFSLEEARFADCPVSKCRVTRDKGQLHNSDAVLFSSRGLWNTFRGYSMPAWRAPHQVWIMTTMEAPPETWLDWTKYNGVFNWTMHYRRDADLVGVYGDVVPRGDKRGVPAVDTETASEASVRNYAKEKTKMVAWMASNCLDDARRQRVVRELSRYIQVDTYGACGDLPQASDCKQGTKNCEGPVLEPYRFYLALENSRCRGYVTEKFFNAMGRAQIPITENDVHSTGRAPRGSFIQTSDFASLKDLAEHLKRLALNETAYNQHLKWRQTHKVQLYTGPWCELCAELHNMSRPTQVYADLYGWLQNDTCQPWSVCNYVKRVFEGLALYLRLTD